MSPYLQEMMAATQRQVFSEKDALELVAPVLAKLKAAPTEERLAFIFEALEDQRKAAP